MEKCKYADVLKRNFLFKWKYLLVVILFWAAFIFMNFPTLFDSKYYLEKIESRGNNIGYANEIAGDAAVVQKLQPMKDFFGGISLYLGAYNGNADGEIQICIKDETGSPVYESSLKTDQLKNNGYYEFRFGGISDSSHHIYSIEISGIGLLKGEEASCFLTDGPPGENSELYIRGERSEYSLKMKVVYENPGVMRHAKIKVCFLICLCILGSLLAVFFMGKRLENNFLLVTVLVSSFYLFFNAFPHPLDEITHYFRSLSISQGGIHDVWNEAHDDIGAYLPENMEETAQYNIVTDLLGYQTYNEKFSENREFAAHHYMSSVVPVNHSIAAVGVALGRLFSLSVKWIIFFGRIATFIFYIAVCYAAIKRARYYKSLYFIVSLLPLGLYVAASFSLDPILVAASLLFIQTTVDYFLDEDKGYVRTKDMFLLVIMSVFIVSVKYLVYTPILLLFFLIPRRKFKTGKAYAAVIGIETVVIFVLLAWQFYLMKALPFSEDRRVGQIVDIGLQLKYITSNVVEASRTIFSFMYNNFLRYMSHFGVFGLNGPIIDQVLTVVVLGFACGCPDKYHFHDQKRKRNFDILSLFILVTIYSLIVLSLFLGFSYVGELQVQGVQPRYFLPIIIFMMFPLSTMNIQCKIKNWELKLTMVFVVMNMGQALNVLKQAIETLGK